MTTPLYAEVLLDLAIDKSFDYAIQEKDSSLIRRGMCVEIPVRKNIRKGFVLGVKEHTTVTNIAFIERIVGTQPVVTEELFTLALWIARYYMCPIGKVLKTMIPQAVRDDTQKRTQYLVSKKATREVLLKTCVELLNSAPKQAAILEVILKSKKDIFLSKLLEETQASASCVQALHEKGLLQLQKYYVDEDPLKHATYFKTQAKILRDEQAHALEKIISSLQQSIFCVHLLWGVTGSGKTEVYLQAMQKALEHNKSVLLLIPEVALTPQTIERLRARFSDEIAILHHRVKASERMDAWKKMQEGTIRIAVGARSAIFSPLQNLGLIIVDEEHETSYKQSEESPCYQARDVAVMRGKLSSCTVVLGSATPSLESFYNAQNNKYVLSVLKSRSNTNLAKVLIVDMKKEYEKAKRVTPFSELLLNKIEDRIAKGEQSILFLNRRGYHTLLSCTTCGKSIECPNCSRSLTSHMKERFLSCHLCGYTQTPPRKCLSCQTENSLVFRGTGTEKIEAMLHAILPKVRTLRIDTDTTRHKGSLDLLLQQFRSGKADVLIGTQMIAKGLHFPEVTLVGVLNCDMSLQIPDFRAQEQVFQLITQVAGRAGRGHDPGEVIVQTCLPEHSTIIHSSKQDYFSFYKEEIEIRKMFDFPPFTHIVKCSFAGKDEIKTREIADQILADIHANITARYTCHPVVPSGHPKIDGIYRFQFLIRGPSTAPIIRAIENVQKKIPIPSTIRFFIDVDPSSTFF